MDQSLYGTATDGLPLNVNIGLYSCEHVDFTLPEIIEEDLAPVYIWPEPIPVNYTIEGMSAPCLTTTKIIRYRQDIFEGEFPGHDNSIAWDQEGVMLTLFNSISSNLTVTIAGNVSHDIYLGYQVIDWSNHSTFVSSQFTIRGKYCALELPSIFSNQTTWSFFVPFTEHVAINLGDGHAGNCTFDSIVTGFDGHHFITTSHIPGLNVTDLLSLDLSARELDETIHLEYTIVPTEFLIPEPITQTITI